MTPPSLREQLDATIKAANDVVTQLKRDSAHAMTNRKRANRMAELELLTARESSLRVAIALSSLEDCVYHYLHQRG